MNNVSLKKLKRNKVSKKDILKYLKLLSNEELLENITDNEKTIETYNKIINKK
jgi:hypothetical protein